MLPQKNVVNPQEPRAVVENNGRADETADIAEIGQRAAEAQERLKRVAATATSNDGAVTVTVNTSGALQQLSFGPRADEISRSALAAAVVATAHRAQAQAAQQLHAIMAPLIGENSDAMKFLDEQIPTPEVPEEQPPASGDTRQFFNRDEEGSVPPPPAPPAPGMRPPAPPAPPAPPSRPARPARPPADNSDDDDYYNGGSILGKGY
ncbi:YbaB/EbfC family nucleoid-associated protein [Amycolatopsis rhabdoformis]|uniref:YbaB/EbfC family nucleoid-associated protein n=1 Tax=Amycolatopsis rhabdoformis TaxID=1448059 RepID=A0ABZ1IKN5_9PSEU|nr:YbaB/EbfC family nucleoid-associated protein [Amycolatopsis rhabdoformis]WSE34822.1 YbaB/EbfC family nucleoid-associated protein [Amycolatopsis rhabdoformis]